MEKVACNRPIPSNKCQTWCGGDGLLGAIDVEKRKTDWRKGTEQGRGRERLFAEG